MVKVTVSAACRLLCDASQKNAAEVKLRQHLF